MSNGDVDMANVRISSGVRLWTESLGLPVDQAVRDHIVRGWMDHTSSDDVTAVYALCGDVDGVDHPVLIWVVVRAPGGVSVVADPPIRVS